MGGEAGKNDGDEIRSKPTPPLPAEPDASAKRLIARDPKRVPLFSSFDWSEEAVERILRIPAGFMRDRTQARIEEQGATGADHEIDLAQVEAGVDLGLEMMAAVVSESEKGAESNRKDSPVPSVAASQAGQCPAVARKSEAIAKESLAQPLNEVSQLSELAAMRLLLTPHGEGDEK
jgi:hypothetical protein